MEDGCLGEREFLLLGCREGKFPILIYVPDLPLTRFDPTPFLVDLFGPVGVPA